MTTAVAQNLGAHLTAGTDIFDYTANGNSPFPPNSNGAAGNVPWNFQIQGAWGDPAENHVVSGNWFYRIVGGDNRERNFTSPLVRTITGSDDAYYYLDKIYGNDALNTQNPDLSAEMDFKLFDTGPYSSLLSTQVCFHNSSSATYEIDVFLSVDFNLGGDAIDDAFAPLSPGGDLWTLTDSTPAGLWTGLMYGPGAVAAGAGNVSSILGALTNTTTTDFTAPPLGHGGGTFADGAAVLQFRLTLSGPTHICIPAYLGIGLNMTPPLQPNPDVPEPACAVLAMIAGSMMLAQRRLR